MQHSKFAGTSLWCRCASLWLWWCVDDVDSSLAAVASSRECVEHAATA